MESKKINQLATELTPSLSDLTIIGDPSTGISKKITLSQMASLFTGTVEEYANVAAFPLVGVADTIYIALDTNVLYRWNTGTNAYVELSPNIINSLVFSDANGFDGTIALVGSVATLTITTALTTGSVGFIGASGALLQDNANFFWDDTNNRLGLGTNAPTTAIDVFGSGIIGRLNGTSTNNAFLGFASAGTNKWSIGNVQSDHRFRIYNEATTSELVSVLSTGEFGIGIANPTTKFHIDGAASALIANLDANVSVAKSISFRSDNSNRINLEVSGTESGSNAGANFFIRRYSDAGALIDTPFTITRSTGLSTFTGNINQNLNDGSLTLYKTDGTTIKATLGNVDGSNTDEGFLALYKTNVKKVQLRANGFSYFNGGYFGIGISEPLSPIHQVTEQTNFTGEIRIGGNTTAFGVVTSFTQSGSTAGSIYSSPGYANASQTFKLGVGSGNTNQIVLKGDSSIGFNTTNTIYAQLNVKQTSAQIYGGLAFYSNNGTETFLGIGNNGSEVGLEATYGASGAFVPIVFRTSSTERLRITAAGVTNVIGNLGVGTATTSGRIHAVGLTANSSGNALYLENAVASIVMQVRNDGLVFFGTASSAPYNYNVTFNPRSAGLGAGGDFGYIVSTRESKGNIQSLNTIDYLKQLNPVSFNYRKKNINKTEFIDDLYEDVYFGFIADEVEKVNKDLVFYDDLPDGTKKLAGVHYNSVIAILTKAIQDQQLQIDELKMAIKNI